MAAVSLCGMVVGGCGGADDAGSVTTTTGPAVPTDVVTVAPTEALAVLTPAVERLLAEPSLAVEGRSRLGGTLETFTVDLDAEQGSYRSLETVGDASGVQATTERIVTPETLYLRAVDDDPAAPPRWSVIPVSVPEEVDTGDAYTLFGRISPSLPDLAAMWAAGPVTVEALADGARRGYRLTMHPADVTAYLIDRDLARVEVSHELGDSVWEVWLDGPDVTGLRGRGTQYFDGEPFTDADVEVTYIPRPVRVTPPPS